MIYLIRLLGGLNKTMTVKCSAQAWYTEGKCLVSVVFVVVTVLLWKLKGACHFGTISEGIPKKEGMVKKILKITFSCHQE